MLLLSPALAQITSDGTTGSSVNQNKTRFQIKGGTTRGKTLFHSFEKFSIPTNKQAYFTNPAEINLILSRITGKGISNIDGTLGVDGGADLFLMNPNGIIFGPNASLDLNGSFLATTGSSFVFEDGKTFSASNPTSVPDMKISVPLGIQFGTNPGAITIRSQFDVDPGKNIAFFGGDLNFINSTVSADGGEIAIGSVNTGGYIKLSSVPNSWSFGYEGNQGYKDINIKNSSIGTFYSQNIRIDGENILIADSFVRANGSTDVNAVNAVDIYGGHVRGDKYLSLGAKKLKLFSGGSLKAGGILNINIIDFIEISGYNKNRHGFKKRSGIYHSSFFENSYVRGININADKIFIRNGGLIRTSSWGSKGGDININANELSLSHGGLIETFSWGSEGGDININANELSLSHGGKVLSLDYNDLFFGPLLGIYRPGQGGNINLNIAGKISISGKDTNTTSSDFIENKFGINTSGIFSASNKESRGRTGDINIRAKEISILDSAQVSINNNGIGTGGNLYVKAQDLELRNQGLISAKGSNNRLGNLNINIDNLLLLRNQSKITYGTEGVGIGGKVNISAPMIIAIPSEDSDILIKAPRAKASITGKEILGLTKRSKPTEMSDIVIDTEDDREPVGEYGRTTKLKVSEFSGIVVKPQKIVKGCRPGQALGDGHFVYRGTGGLPPNPYQNRTMPAVWQDLRLHNLESNSINKHIKLSHQLSKAVNDKEKHQTQREEVDAAQEIIEAKGWIRDKKGQIILTSSLKKYVATANYQPTAAC